MEVRALQLTTLIAAPIVGIDVFIPDDITDTHSYTIIELYSNPVARYLPKRSKDHIMLYAIIRKVLANYFKLNHQ